MKPGYKLAQIERARKMLNLAYDPSAQKGERENALAMATATLAKIGLTVDDLKQESTPDYLLRPRAVDKTFDEKRATRMARGLKQSGWVPQDPRTEAYKNRGE